MKRLGTKRDTPENVNNCLYYPSVYFLLLNSLSYTLFHLRLLHFLPAECATVIISTDLLCDIVCFDSLDSLVSTKLLWLECHYSIFVKNN